MVRTIDGHRWLRLGRLLGVHGVDGLSTGILVKIFRLLSELSRVLLLRSPGGSINRLRVHIGSPVRGAPLLHYDLTA